MDANRFRFLILGAAIGLMGASHRTQNFIITADTPQLAQKIGQVAEQCRRELAIEWLGAELPPWSDPCPIRVHAAPHLAAGGMTSFSFDRGNRGRPMAWQMVVQGTPERIMDSVLPHEITHTVFATHFRRPLPRWADEGACTTVEHLSERRKQHRLLIEHLSTRRGIAFNRMFAMREYPDDMLPLYSQGYSLTRFLIQQGGRKKFVQYIGDGMAHNDWSTATRKHYGFHDLSELQTTWEDWVKKGSRPLSGPLVAQRDEPTNNSSPVVLASATESTKGGWYSRQADRARQRSTKSSEEAPPKQPAGQSSQVLTRPSPPQRAKQRVIDY